MTTIQRPPNFKKDFYENQAWEHHSTVMGIDEVGRGCLAGPVVAAAVILHPNKKSRLIKDSKLLDHEELIKAYTWITRNSWWGVGIINHRRIDDINIYQASMRAMSRAATQVLSLAPQQPSCIVIDAMPLTLQTFTGDVVAFIHGESKSTSIAAASIVAKVTRDSMLTAMDTTFPGYNLKGHKGYSTQAHKAALFEKGACIIHRETFIDHMDPELIQETQDMLNFLSPEKEIIHE